MAPKLYVMDGIVAMEGNGPGSGDPVPMNVLLMSTDPVSYTHLDVYKRQQEDRREASGTCSECTSDPG